MFFGALILAFTVYRLACIRAFSEGAHELDVIIGAINAGSGLTMSIAIDLNKM